MIPRSQQFDIEVAWKISGEDVLTRLGGAGNSPWNVSVYAESIGTAPDRLLGSVNVPQSAFVVCGGTNCRTYKATITVPPATLLLHIPSNLQTGIYRILASVFMDSPNTGGDAIGFAEGPVIQVEDL